MDIDIRKSSAMPLHAQIRKQILAMIECGTLEKDSPISPEMELVERYGISRTVVRHALNDLTDEGYLYRIRGKGTFVSSRPQKERAATDLVALVMPSQQSGSMFSDIIVGSQNSAALGGFDLIFSNSKDNAIIESEYIERLMKKVRGFIIFLSDDYPHLNISRKTLENLRKENIPFVLIDRHMPGLDSDFVGTDNFAGAYNAVTELFLENYENIACVICDDWKQRSALAERLDGYRKAIRDNGRKEIVIEVKRRKGDMPAVAELLRREKNVGIFSPEIFEAAKILELALKHKRGIPEDIGIIGFDKAEIHTQIPLSIVTQPMRAIGEKAAKLLLERINGGKASKAIEIRLKPELVLSESTRLRTETKRRAS